jgi:hypothetical protein
LIVVGIVVREFVVLDNIVVSDIVLVVDFSTGERNFVPVYTSATTISMTSITT